MNLNFGELMAAAGPIEALPVGDYDVICKTAEATSTKDGSKPMIKCKFSVETGPHAGRTIYWNAVISQENPTALRIFFVQMEALGLNSAFFSASPSLEQVAQNLVGKRARFNVGHRQYQGQTQIDVKRVSPAASGVGAGLAGMLGGAPPFPAAAPAPAPAPVPPVAEQPTPPPPLAEPVAAAAGGPPPAPF